jgi:hypothetical protein
MEKPPGFEKALSEFKECSHDYLSDKPIAWGFELLGAASPAEMEALRAYGELRYSSGKWYLVTHQLTRDEAVAAYGPVGAEISCKGATNCSVAFGDTKLVTDTLCTRT